MREQYLQTKILKALRERGGWWRKFHTEGRYAGKGNPDIIGAYKSFFVAFEVKRPGEKLTPLQEATLNEIRELGDAISCKVSTDDACMCILDIIDREVTKWPRKVIMKG